MKTNRQLHLEEQREAVLAKAWIKCEESLRQIEAEYQAGCRARARMMKWTLGIITVVMALPFVALAIKILLQP